MNCQLARESFPELLDPRTAPTAHAEARAHLANCPDCQREFAALSQTLAALDTMPTPQPSAGLRRNFYAMLEEEKHSAESARITAERKERRRRLSFVAWILAPIGACALLGLGFFAGSHYGAVPVTPTVAATDLDTKRQIQELRQQSQELRSKLDRVETMNQLVAAAFQRQQQPANERMNTILTSSTQQSPTDMVINELIASLALDPSANVRLRALEALYPHAKQEVVRAGVLASLSREGNPLVQVAMIDFLAAARDREAKSTLEKMAISEGTDGNVREAAKRAIAQL